MGGLIALCHGLRAPVCVFHRLTGLPCLTCGSTRAFADLLRGDLAGALRLQPLAVVGGGALVAAATVYAWYFLVRRRVPHVRLGGMERRLVWVALVAALVLNWVYLILNGV